LLIGVDGSSSSRHAISFVARLAPPPRARATVIQVLEPARLPSMGLLPSSIRAELEAQAAAMRSARMRAARRHVEVAVGRLEQSGWQARGEVREGRPVPELLAAVKANRADLLVLGARGVGRVEGFLLGSVADAVTKYSPISVLIVR
jgi:nucleotide-binding universal stress UspA family protein